MQVRDQGWSSSGPVARKHAWNISTHVLLISIKPVLLSSEKRKGRKHPVQKGGF